MPPAFFSSRGIDKTGRSVIIHFFTGQRGDGHETFHIKTLPVRFYLIIGPDHADLLWRLTRLSRKVLCVSAGIFRSAVI